MGPRTTTESSQKQDIASFITQGQDEEFKDEFNEFFRDHSHTTSAVIRGGEGSSYKGHKQMTAL